MDDGSGGGGRKWMTDMQMYYLGATQTIEHCSVAAPCSPLSTFDA